MCERCDAYGDSLPARDATMLTAILDMVRTAETAGDLEWLDGERLAAFVSPAATASGAHGPGDVPRTGRWLCSACSRMFLLELGSHHATGDGWRPLYGN